MEPVYTIALLGAAGGLISTINWVVENQLTSSQMKEPLLPMKVIRNVLLGAASALAAIASTSPEVFPLVNPQILVLAVTSGFAGEFILQKGGRIVDSIKVW